MIAPTCLGTERLLLRRWQSCDLDKFAEMNADTRVMEFFPNALDADQSRRLAERIESGFDLNGFGLWALEIEETSEFIGFTGLSVPTFQAHFMPCVEVGWRLALPYWGRGYAPEAAKEALRDGFERVGLTEIVSFTAAVNARSTRVMEKIGMSSCSQDDFLHPALADGHRLKPHVLYRLTKNAWERRQLAGTDGEQLK